MLGMGAVLGTALHRFEGKVSKESDMDSRTNPLAWLAMTTAGLLGGLLIASPAKAEGSAQFIYHVSHSVFGDIGTYTNTVEPTRDGVTVKTQAHFEVKRS